MVLTLNNNIMSEKTFRWVVTITLTIITAAVVYALVYGNVSNLSTIGY